MLFLGSRARLALRAPPPRDALPTLVLDLDETVLHRPGGLLDQVALYAYPSSTVGVPYAHALESLRALSARFNLAAITARFRLAEGNTTRWLEAQGLADLPA